MSGDVPPGKVPEAHGKTTKPKTGVHCMAPGCVSWYYKCKEKKFHRLPKQESRRKQWLQMLKLACPPAAGSARVCSYHFTDDDYVKKDFVDENGVTTKLKTAYLVKDAVPSILDFSTYSYTSTDRSASTTTGADNREMRKKRRERVTQVSRSTIRIAVTMLTYHYEYNIVRS